MLLYCVCATVRDDGDMAGKIGEGDRERMEATLAEALEWLEEQDGAMGQTREDYEKLREVEEVCYPIIKQVGGGDGGMAQDGRAAQHRIGVRRRISFW
jgi:heat shock protein 5